MLPVANVEYLETEGEQSSQAKLLTSLLPAIRKSVAEKSGTILDDDTEYKILGQADGELHISCTTSDGKEYEIELMTEGEFFAVGAKRAPTSPSFPAEHYKFRWAQQFRKK